MGGHQQHPRRHSSAALEAETVALDEERGGRRGGHRQPEAPPRVPEPAQPRRSRRTEPPRANGWAMWALVLGIITVALSPIPILNQGGILVGFVACGIAIPALVIGVKHGTRRGMAITGAVLAVLGLILSFVITASYVSSINRALSPGAPDLAGGAPSSDAPSGPVTYDLEISSPNLKTVEGVTWSNSTGGIDQASSARLPWHKTVTIQPNQVVTVTASTPSQGKGGTVTCTIRQGTRAVSSKTASGSFANSDCTSFSP